VLKKLRRPGKKELSSNPKRAEEPATLDEERKQVLKKARIHKKPLNLGRHKVLAMTAIILLVLFVGSMASISYLIYSKKSDSTLVYKVSRVVPFPVAKINGSFVSYADYLFDVRYRKNLYENPSSSSAQEPVDFESEEGKQLLISIQNDALEQAKTKAIIKQMAKEQDVTVSQDELNKAVEELIQSQGGEKKFKNAIEEFYGWDMDDFRKEYRIQLLQQKLQLGYLPGISEEQRKKAEELRTKVTAGEDFSALATANSEDPGSKDTGGDLGFIGPDTPFVKEFKDVALKLEPGQVSAVVQTQFGFHIIKATEKKDNQVKVSHILISYSKDIDSVIAEKLAEAKISEYLKLPAPAPPSDVTTQQPAT